MHSLLIFILGALQISLLDIALSGDNIGVIALATKDLPKNIAKKASLVGVSAAIFLRIIFACLVTYIMMIQWLPIKLIGGILLIKITWDFIKPNPSNEDTKVNPSTKFFSAITSIIIADITMSLDNVLAIAATANGNITLIVFGILINIPIIFYGSQYVSFLMNKYPITIYFGGAILAHTSFKMLLEDRLLAHYIPHNFIVIFPHIMALVTLLYGIYAIKNSKKQSTLL